MTTYFGSFHTPRKHPRFTPRRGKRGEGVNDGVVSPKRETGSSSPTASTVRSAPTGPS